MEWEDINLSRYRIAGAPYGGPIGKYYNLSSTINEIIN